MADVQGAQQQPSQPQQPEQDEDEQRIQEQKKINEEYKVWKKNAVFLYDTVISHALEWPTLTCQWFPDVERHPGKAHETHRLLIGTHTSDAASNYLQIAEVQVPRQRDEVDAKTYDEERGEAGGYGGAGSAEAKVSVIQRIDHEGEVNKARYRPANPNVIATMTPSGDVLIFDRTMHSLHPSGTCKPQIRLRGHKAEGYGMSWHPGKRDGLLLTAAEDVRLWDIESVGTLSADGEAAVLDDCQVFRSHKSAVNDVQWHPAQENWFGSVSDDTFLHVHDIRLSESRDKPTHAVAAHADPVNCLAFAPHNPYLVATGSADHTVGLWDLRNLKRRLHALEGHDGDVQCVAWHPSDETILASAGTDRKLLLWDLSRIGEEQSDDDAQDGPPELLFMHAGHTDLIHDFSWNQNRPWTIASAAQDNILQIWQPGAQLTGHDDVDDDEEEEEDDEEAGGATSKDVKMSDK